MAAEHPYRIDVYKGFWPVLERQPAAQQERIPEFMANHFAVRPKVMIPGQLKKLKATHAHLYQLDCARDRLLYEVNDDTRTVRIIYLGPHPEWDKLGKTKSL